MTQIFDWKKHSVNAYSVLAAQRNTFAGNPKTWEPEAQRFGKMLAPGSSVLDIGCGGGRDALLLEPMGYRYLGIDNSSEMLTEARKLAPNSRFRVADMAALSFSSGSFDGFWAAAVLLHVPKVHLGRVLREIRRVTRQGGAGSLQSRRVTASGSFPGHSPEATGSSRSGSSRRWPMR